MKSLTKAVKFNYLVSDDMFWLSLSILKNVPAVFIPTLKHWKSVGSKTTTLNPIDFHCMYKKHWDVFQKSGLERHEGEKLIFCQKV